MISKIYFLEALKKLALLLNVPWKQGMGDALYSKLQNSEQQDFDSAVDSLVEDPPPKFSYAVLKGAVNRAKSTRVRDAGEIVTYWDGTECEYCHEGMIYTIEIHDNRRYSYAWKCPICDSYKAMIPPYYPRKLIKQSKEVDGYLSVLPA